jgi:esterase/lipase
MTETTPKKRRSRVRIVLYLLLLLIVAGGIAWLFGPREPVDLTVRFDDAAIGADIDAWLADNEAKFDDIRPEATKEIIWAWPASRAKTPVAFVVLHGFSAAKGEIRPVPDMVARELGANLFFTRLAGHGRDGEAMAEPTVNDWIQDMAEAVAVAERIGEKVVVVANSTGGTLAVLAATLPEFRDRIDALVLISPNFRIKASGSWLLTQPLRARSCNWSSAPNARSSLMNDEHARHWTYRYPSVALLPMAALVKTGAALPFEQIGIPPFSSIIPTTRWWTSRSPPKSPRAGAGRSERS